MWRSLIIGAAIFAIPAFASAETNVITLGSAVQLTGQLANTGRYYRDAYGFAVDAINRKGGIEVDGKHYKFALKLLDNQSNVDLGVRECVQLITSDKVNFLLGPYSSNDTISQSSIAEKYQVPMIESGASSRQIFSRGYKYIFGTLSPADRYFASTIAMMEKLTPRAKTIALVSANDEFDIAVAAGTRKLLKEAGLEIVVDQTYSENQSNFSSILSQVKSAQPDTLLWAGHEPEALDFIRQMKSLNVNPTDLYAFTVGIQTADFRKALGVDAEYAFGMTSWLPSPSLKDEWFGNAESFAETYQAKYGYAPDYHAAAATAAVEAYAKAVEAAGSIDPKKIRDAIARLDFESVYGRIRFPESGQMDLPLEVIQIQRGQVVPIYSTEFINKPQYPIPPWDKRRAATP